MLTPQDDLLGHQTPATFDQPSSSDLRWTERYWYSGHRVPGGDIIFDIGFGQYPNRNVMDAFAGVTVAGIQHNFRASRRLHTKTQTALDPCVGPLRVEILEGMRRHRLVLEPNESGIAFDLTFIASTEGAQELQSFRRRLSRVEEDLTRMSQFARWEGWLEVAGTRYQITPGEWWGQRDHSWGVRSEMRTDFAAPPMQTHADFFWMWCMYQFEDFGICLFTKERSSGANLYLSGTESPRLGKGGKARHIVGVEHDLEWADDVLGQSIAQGDLQFRFEDGATRRVKIEMLPGRFYLKGGLYGGFNGWNHGDDRGPYHAEHDAWDLRDPLTRERARTLGDHVTRVSCDGAIGYGISEYGVAAGFPRYAVAQKHPAL
jgi:hypothetical protein